MNRLSVVGAKRALLGVTMLMVCATPSSVAIALAATTPPMLLAQDPDPLKFTENKPTVIGWVIRADKTTEFEEAWAGIKALLAKSEKDDLKAFGATLDHIYKVDQPPFAYAGPPAAQAVIYIFRLDNPSTAYSYNPRAILYEYLKAGQEGGIPRADADKIYTEKLTAAYLTINPLWKLTKIGG